VNAHSKALNRIAGEMELERLNGWPNELRDIAALLSADAEPVAEVYELSNGERHIRAATPNRLPVPGTMLYASPSSPGAAEAGEACPSCNGAGVIGTPGAPCQFCKLHQLGQAHPQAEAEARQTGWPAGMLQDDSRELSRALASKPDAMLHSREATAAIAAPREGAGWKLVPAEPTEAMKRAAVEWVNGADIFAKVPAEVTRIEGDLYGAVFEAMLAAAPQEGTT
jgi:hypothetical protein